MENTVSSTRDVEALGKTSPLFTLTPRAREMLADALKNGYEGYYVRVDVFQGTCGCGGACGCGGGGLSYAMSLSDTPFEGDFVEEVDGIKFATPKETLELVRGSTIDYYEGLDGRGFIVINPNTLELDAHEHEEDGECACGGTCTCGRH